MTKVSDIIKMIESRLNPIEKKESSTPSSKVVKAGTAALHSPERVASGPHEMEKREFESLKLYPSGTPAQQVLQAKLYQEQPAAVEAIRIIAEGTDEAIPDVENLTIENLKKVVDAYTIETSQVSNAKGPGNYYSDATDELNRLKDQLGGCPHFKDGIPFIDTEESHRTLFGIPISAVKDYIRIALATKQFPQFFWKLVGLIFGIKEETMLTPYETTYLKIQRFELLKANEKRIFEILDNKEEAHYNDFCKLTGLTWHLNLNSNATEKQFMQYVEVYLTKHFEDAKKKGDAALVEYFRDGFGGACFEDRVREMMKFAENHPLEEAAAEVEMLRKVSDLDYSANSSVEKVFTEENKAFHQDKEGLGTPAEFKAHLQGKGIFTKEFEGKKPTLEQLLVFSLQQGEYFTLQNYSMKDYLLEEIAILKELDPSPTLERVISQIERRKAELGMEISVFPEGYPVEGEEGDTVELETSSETVREIIKGAL